MGAANKYFFPMRKIKVTVFILVFLGVLGCASEIPVRYEIAHSEFRIDDGSIAIIPGGIYDDENLISDEIVRQLSSDHRYKLADVKVVKKCVSAFRAGVIDDDFSFPEEKPTSYLSNENRERITALQRSLGMKNLVIIWTEGWTVAEIGAGNEYYVTLYSRIINEKGVVTGYPAFVEKIKLRPLS